MQNRNILIIDDDITIGEELKDFLIKYGHKPTFCQDSTKALNTLHQIQPDIILLDVMMPTLDGFELCKQIRQNYQTPIIFLSARSDVMDRIVGLEIGADDYLPKPFEPRELLARIESILRRSQNLEKNVAIIIFGNLEIDCQKRQAYLNQQEIELTTMEFELLLLFAKNNRKKFTRDDIMNHLKGIDDNVYSRSVDILISRLRQKLQDEDKKLIETVWGTGYMFNAKEK